MPFADDLRRIVKSNEAFMEVLRAVRSVSPPSWCVGAGAVRSLVWDVLHGRQGWRVPADIDVAYFDGGDLSEESEAGYATALRALRPDLPWEVVNQARVHLWYGQRFGQTVPALHTLEEALATWPEYATCVGVRLNEDDGLEIIAPFGLSDLFSMTLRHNPSRVGAAEYRARQQAKRYPERWPRVTVVLP